MKLRSVALAFALLFAAPEALAGNTPTPPQCGDMGDIVDFYGGSSHFQSLPERQCVALCRKAAGECRKFVKQGQRCAKQAVNAQLGIEKKVACDPLQDGAARRACKQELEAEAAELRAGYDADAHQLLNVNGCVFVRNSCSAECEGS